MALSRVGWVLVGQDATGAPEDDLAVKAVIDHALVVGRALRIAAGRKQSLQCDGDTVGLAAVERLDRDSEPAREVLRPCGAEGVVAQQ